MLRIKANDWLRGARMDLTNVPLLSALRASRQVVIPLWAGFSYDHFGKGVPFITSSILVLGSLFLGLGVDDGRKVKAAPVVGEPAL